MTQTPRPIRICIYNAERRLIHVARTARDTAAVRRMALRRAADKGVPASLTVWDALGDTDRVIIA